MSHSVLRRTTALARRVHWEVEDLTTRRNIMAADVVVLLYPLLLTMWALCVTGSASTVCSARLKPAEAHARDA
eukprot:6162980-Pyramimonas_sp.AAC.3